MSVAGFSRREFLERTGALVVSFSAAAVAGEWATGTAAAQAPARAAPPLDSWIAVAQDGSVRAFTGKCELGQGLFTAQAQLIAELLSHQSSLRPGEIDDEADRIAADVKARVTLIARDGRVLGDSTLGGEPLEKLENHAARPEVASALAGRIGIVERYSTTTSRDMLYVAVPAPHPLVSVVRVSLGLTDVAEQLRRVGRSSLIAFLFAAAVAVALAWATSLLIGRRVDAIAAVARRYSDGDVARVPHDYGTDELGAVARGDERACEVFDHEVSPVSRCRSSRPSLRSLKFAGEPDTDARAIAAPDGWLTFQRRALRG